MRKLITKVNRWFDAIGYIKPIGDRSFKSLGVHLTRYGLTELIYTKKGDRIFLRFHNPEDIPSISLIVKIVSKYHNMDGGTITVGTGFGDDKIPYANHCKYYGLHYKYEMKDDDLTIVEKVA